MPRAPQERLSCLLTLGVAAAAGAWVGLGLIEDLSGDPHPVVLYLTAVGCAFAAGFSAFSMWLLVSRIRLRLRGWRKGPGPARLSRQGSVLLLTLLAILLPGLAISLVSHLNHITLLLFAFVAFFLLAASGPLLRWVRRTLEPRRETTLTGHEVLFRIGAEAALGGLLGGWALLILIMMAGSPRASEIVIGFLVATLWCGFVAVAGELSKGRSGERRLLTLLGGGILAFAAVYISGAWVHSILAGHAPPVALQMVLEAMQELLRRDIGFMIWIPLAAFVALGAARSAQLTRREQVMIVALATLAAGSPISMKVPGWALLSVPFMFAAVGMGWGDRLEPRLARLLNSRT